MSRSKTPTGLECSKCGMQVGPGQGIQVVGPDGKVARHCGRCWDKGCVVSDVPVQTVTAVQLPVAASDAAVKTEG